jgi:hypothetical protein
VSTSSWAARTLARFLIERADAAVGRDVIVQFDGGFRITACDFAGSAQPRQQAIAGWRGRRQAVEGRLGLGMLVLLGELDGLVEGDTGLDRLLGLQVLIAAPAADRGAITRSAPATM